MISCRLRSILLLTALTFASGQIAPEWGQCGGQGWTGTKICPPGFYCHYTNPYHDQCLPGSSEPGPLPGAPTYWFSFGDSYTSTGFDFAGTLPNDNNTLGNPAFPGKTTTPGANWLGWLTTTFNSSTIYTYNFAVSGATIDANLVAPSNPNIPPVTTQVQSFLGIGGNRPPTTSWTTGNSLFSFFIGINDIGKTYNQGGDRSIFSGRLIDTYFARVQQVCNVGARSILIVNVPPVDRSPMMRQQSAANRQIEKDVIIDFNKKLLARMAYFKLSNPNVNLYHWDSWSLFTSILDSPTSYGFRDATSVGTGPDTFWGDTYHPSSAAHKIFAESISATVLNGTYW